MTNPNKANELIIKIALLIAFCDDEFHDSESKIIKNWIEKKTKGLTEQNRTKLKKSYEIALEKSIKSNDSSITDLCLELLSLGPQMYNFDALELSIEIMTADNLIHPNEVKLIYQLSKILKISDKDVIEIIDKSILGMSQIPKNIDVEGLLKIDPTVSNIEADKAFQKTFVKWNHLTTSASTNFQRKISQKMLDVTSDVGDKYT